MFGAAEDLVTLSAAAQSEPRLQAVDGVSTAAEVTDPGFREEAGWVSGTALTIIADGSQVLSGGTGRWERHVRLIENVFLGLCGQTKLRLEKYIEHNRFKSLEEITSYICAMKSE